MTRRHDTRRINPRLSYLSNEIAALMSVTKLTVYKWKAEGLAPIDDRKPFLFHGSTLRLFLERRNKPFVPLEPGQFYCTPCKAAREPTAGSVIWIDRAETNGDIVGTCPVCGRRLYRRVRRDRLHLDLGNLRIVNEDGTVTVVDARDAPHTIASEGSA